MSKKRTIINYRKIGDQVNPENMTHKEYINYLCHKFGFSISAGWDGVEKRHYRPNYTPEKSYNISSRDEALEFLGITKAPESPDGIEHRYSERRQKHTKFKGKNRRTHIRRKDELKAQKQDAILYYSALGLGFLLVIIIYGIILQELLAK